MVCMSVYKEFHIDLRLRSNSNVGGFGTHVLVLRLVQEHSISIQSLQYIVAYNSYHVEQYYKMGVQNL